LQRTAAKTDGTSATPPAIPSSSTTKSALSRSPLCPRNPGSPHPRRRPMVAATLRRRATAAPRERSSIPTAGSTWPGSQCPFIPPSEARQSPKARPLPTEQATGQGRVANSGLAGRECPTFSPRLGPD
jgi:hypothetical protein